MITVDRESWHWRVYLWWYRMKYSNDCFPERSNLCPYVRAVLLWSWMRWLFISGRLGQWPAWMRKRWGFERFPVPLLTWAFLAVEAPRWLGMVSFTAKELLYSLELAALAIAAFFGLALGIAYLHAEKHAFHGLAPIQRGGASFLHLLHEYLRAAHDRVCPEITLAGPES